MSTVSFKTVCQVWLYYILAFIPGAPSIGRLSEAVCIFVQAFGRNMLDDSILNRVIWGLREHFGFDDQRVFREMRQRDYDPGDSNLTLARHSLRLAQLYSIPIIAQWEIIYAIYLIAPDWYRENRSLLDAIWPPREGYFATYHVKELSQQRMQARQLRGRPLEVAHPSMTTRAIPILWQLGLNPVVEGISWRLCGQHRLWRWDRRSVQPWTRDFGQWIAWRPPAVCSV